MKKRVTQLWLVGEEPENCTPLGDRTADDYGVEATSCIRARSASEAIRKMEAKARRVYERLMQKRSEPRSLPNE